MTTTSAFATSAEPQTCPWPYVCFYNNNGEIQTMYRDYGLQNTGSKTQAANWMMNARHDDCVNLYINGFPTYKIYPGQSVGVASPVVKIEILHGC